MSASCSDLNPSEVEQLSPESLRRPQHQHWSVEQQSKLPLIALMHTLPRGDWTMQLTWTPFSFRAASVWLGRDLHHDVKSIAHVGQISVMWKNKKHGDGWKYGILLIYLIKFMGNQDKRHHLLIAVKRLIESVNVVFVLWSWSHRFPEKQKFVSFCYVEVGFYKVSLLI